MINININLNFGSLLYYFLWFKSEFKILKYYMNVLASKSEKKREKERLGDNKGTARKI